MKKIKKREVKQIKKSEKAWNELNKIVENHKNDNPTEANLETEKHKMQKVNDEVNDQKEENSQQSEGKSKQSSDKEDNVDDEDLIRSNVVKQ